MGIQTTTVDDVNVVTVDGMVDPGTAASLMAAIREMWSSGQRKFLLDMSRVTGIHPLALREFISIVGTTRTGKLAVVAQSPEVQTFFKKSVHIPYYDTQEAALAALK